MVKVSLYDTQFSVDRGDNPSKYETENNPHWDNFRDLTRFLGQIGFYVDEDKEIKKRYPLLNKYRRWGRYGDLQFRAEWHSNVFHIQFYQDVSYVNPQGGYFDFDKRKKMPYLIGKQYDLTQKKLFRYFTQKAYEIKDRNKQFKGVAFIINDYINSRHHPQSEWFDLREVEGITSEPDYNTKDRDGIILRNGEVKYFRDYSGYLKRGKVYHNINNMWWVILPCGTVRNMARFELFDLRDEDKRGRLKVHTPPEEYVKRKEELGKCSAKELRNELRRRGRHEL